MSKYQTLKDEVNRLNDIVLAFDKSYDDWEDRPGPSYELEADAHLRMTADEAARLEIAEGNLYRARAVLIKYEQSAAELLAELAGLGENFRTNNCPYDTLQDIIERAEKL